MTNCNIVHPPRYVAETILIVFLTPADAVNSAVVGTENRREHARTVREAQYVVSRQLGGRLDLPKSAASCVFRALLKLAPSLVSSLDNHLPDMTFPDGPFGRPEQPRLYLSNIDSRLTGLLHGEI